LLRLQTISVNHPIHALVIDPGFARCHAAHALYQQVGGDGAVDDALYTTAVQVDRFVFVYLGDLYDNSCRGIDLENFGDRVSYHRANGVLHQDHV
jgi:hypothetical protein